MDDQLTEDELRRLEALAATATPGPWQKIAPAADLDFIAAARSYMPRLIREVRRLRESRGS
jgi:hypothetical protein